MSDLAQQCEEIRDEWGAICEERRQLRLEFDMDDSVDVAGALLAYISELKAELAELRHRPVVQSDSAELAEVRRKDSAWTDECLERAVFEGLGAMKDRRTALRALDHSEREKAMVGEALRWALEEGIILTDSDMSPFRTSAEFHRHIEPPKHLRPILLQYAGSKQA